MPCPLRPIVAFVAILISVVWAARALLRPAKEQVATSPLPRMSCHQTLGALSRDAAHHALYQTRVHEDAQGTGGSGWHWNVFTGRHLRGTASPHAAAGSQRAKQA
jgi:hypothetical protein